MRWEFTDSDVSIWVCPGILDAALIPLVEFREQQLMQKYEVELDPEALGLLDFVSREKQVCMFLGIYFKTTKKLYNKLINYRGLCNITDSKVV